MRKSREDMDDAALACLARAAVNGRVGKPAGLLVDEKVCAFSTSYQVLRRLEEAGDLKIEHGIDNRTIAAVILKKQPVGAPPRRADEALAAAAPAAPPAAVVAPPPPPPAPVVEVTPLPSVIRGAVVALVDYNNVELTTAHAGFRVEWKRMREYLRMFGPLVMADAFVSPRANHRDTVAVLHAAGFHPIACPQSHKDSDAVDAMIVERAHSYLALAPLARIVIVSQDRDFRPIAERAADLGCDLTLVDPVRIRESIEGENDAPVIEPTRKQRDAAADIGRFVDGVPAESPAEATQRMFTEEVLYRIAQREQRDVSIRLTFPVLVGHVSERIRSQLKFRGFTDGDVKITIGALHDCNLLLKSDTTPAYYELNREMPFVAKIIERAVHAQETKRAFEPSARNATSEPRRTST